MSLSMSVPVTYPDEIRTRTPSPPPTYLAATRTASQPPPSYAGVIDLPPAYTDTPYCYSYTHVDFNGVIITNL